MQFTDVKLCRFSEVLQQLNQYNLALSKIGLCSLSFSVSILYICYLLYTLDFSPRLRRLP